MLFKRKHGLHFADGRVVVVDGNAVVKRDEHLIGIGVIVADLAEDLADDERPDCSVPSLILKEMPMRSFLRPMPYTLFAPPFAMMFASWLMREHK